MSNLVWIAVARQRRVTRSRLAQLVALESDQLDAALTPLTQDGRVRVNQGADDVYYSSDECVIGFGEPAGWEASVFDHYQAMVIALCTKLRSGQTSAKKCEWVGGSTYGFDIWPDHPLHDEVVGFLEQTRARASDLRARVDRVNTRTPPFERDVRRVIAYVGQTVIESEESGGKELA